MENEKWFTYRAKSDNQLPKIYRLSSRHWEQTKLISAFNTTFSVNTDFFKNIFAVTLVDLFYPIFHLHHSQSSIW